MEMQAVKQIWHKFVSFFHSDHSASDLHTVHQMVKSTLAALMIWTVDRPGVALSRTKAVATLQTVFRLFSGILTLTRKPEKFSVTIDVSQYACTKR